MEKNPAPLSLEHGLKLIKQKQALVFVSMQIHKMHIGEIKVQVTQPQPLAIFERKGHVTQETTSNQSNCVIPQYLHVLLTKCL